ncbi:MAG: hypothetical protein AAFY24_02060 [Pseudomonadota bacterium]
MTDYAELKKLAEARTALMNYQQADMDGIIVKASRQAIHEVDAAVDELLAQNASLKAEVGELKKAAVREAKNAEYWNSEKTRLVAECADLRTALQKAREALELVQQNCEASASDYKKRVETIHGITRLYLGADDGS